MQINEVNAKSILRKHKRIDSWFISKYGINLYRGCSHDCAYCDGRAEGYYVEGDFSKDIIVKVNAEELLNRELDRTRKRKLMPTCFITLGGGVSDAYQHIEKKYELSRKTLLLIEKYNWPVHILTKSNLVLRDLDIIKRINEKSKAIVSFSFSSVDDEISKIFENGSSLPSKRLEAIKIIKEAGITTGIFYMPVIPLITDSKKQMEETLNKCKEAGVEFAIFGSMTLKPGRQKEYFMNVLKEYYPMYVERYNKHYLDNNKYGAPSHEYRVFIHKQFKKIADELNIPIRIPSYYFEEILSKKDLAAVILDQMGYLSRVNNLKNNYSYASYQLSLLKTDIELLSFEELSEIKGIGDKNAKIIKEIIETGKCKYYEKLLRIN